MSDRTKWRLGVLILIFLIGWVARGYADGEYDRKPTHHPTKTIINTKHA